MRGDWGPVADIGSELRTRNATRADIPGIVSVCTTSLAEGEDIGFGSESDDNPFTDATRLTAAWQEPNRVREEELLVADLKGRVVGVVTVQARGESLELIDIDVPLELQGRGIGSRLVHAVEERARREGKAAVTLGTSRNAAGIPWKSLPWWQAQGYRITHEEENAWTRSI